MLPSLCNSPKFEPREASLKTMLNFRALCDASSDMIFLHTDDGGLVDVNENALRNYGYTRREMLTRTFAELSGKHCSHAKAQQHVARVLAGENLDFDWTARRKDGSEFPVEVRLRHFAGDTGLPGASVLAVLSDRSELQLATTEFKIATYGGETQP